MDAVDDSVSPIAGLRALLDRLVAERIPHAIVTNAPRTQATHTLNALKLSSHFGERVVIGEECAKPKPWPHPYLAGLRMVDGDASRTVAFEDSPSGIAAARAANLYTIGVMSSRTEQDLTAAGEYTADCTMRCLTHHPPPPEARIIASAISKTNPFGRNSRRVGNVQLNRCFNKNSGRQGCIANNC